MAQSKLRFQLSPVSQSDLFVSFANDDFSEAKKVLQKTDLATVQVVDMYEFLEYISSSNCVDRVRFLEQFPDLLESSEEVTVIPLLDSVYKLLDRVSTGWVRIDDLCASLSVYVAGSKSDKLSTLWGVFCSNQDGTLSDSELWRLFRSLLCGLFALSSYARSTQWLTTIRTIDDAAGELVEDLKRYNPSDSNGTTFEALGKWYTGRAGTIQWMELLDVKKWPQEGFSRSDSKTERSQQIPQRAPVPPGTDVVPSAPPPTEEDASDVLSIEVGDCGEPMVISKNTLQVLQYMHTVVGFNKWRPKEMLRLFYEYEQLGGLFKENFEKCVEQLCRGNKLTIAEQRRVQEFLMQVFDSFDLLDIEQVETKEIGCGFLVLSKGTKSEKLEAAFQLFAENDDYETSADITVSRSSLFLMMRSFLNMLWIFSDSFDSDTGLASIESSAANFAFAVITFSNKDGSTNDSVSFATLAEWYNSGGCKQFSWIELLDPAKWSLQSTGPEKPMKASNPERANEIYSDVTLSFALTDDGAGLELEGQHSQMVHETARITGLSNITVGTFAQAYVTQLLPASYPSARESQILVVDKQSFDRFIRAIIPGTGFSAEDKAWLSGLFNTIFWLESHRAVWATGNREEAAVDGIATSLSMFLAGSKSEKLTFAFAAFNGVDVVETVQEPELAENVDVSPKDMERMIGSFLVPIVAVTVCQNKSGIDAWARTITQCSCEVSQVLLSQGNRRSARAVSFENFRQWYNEVGYQKIPWLELLAFNKWPLSASDTDVADDRAVTSASKPTSIQNQVAFPFAVLAISREGEDRVVLANEAPSPEELDEQHLSHPDESGFLYITFDNCRALREFIRITRLDSNDVNTIVTLLLDRSSSGHITQRGFHKVMRRLIDAQQLEREESVFASRALDRLFMAFDRSKCKEVSFWEFTIGLSIFASGTKSEKLSTAWTLLDDDNDNGLKRVQIWRLLRSFLTGIIMVKYLAVDQLSRDQLTSLCEDVDIACVRLTEAAVNYIKRNSWDGGDILSFEEFSAWYNDEGCNMAPWLELLDLRKWPKHLDSSSSPDYSLSEKGGSAIESDKREAGMATQEEALTFTLSGKGHVLALSDADVSNVSRLLNLSKLGNVPAEDAVEVLLEECVEETLDKGSFNKAMRKLVDVGGMSDEDKNFLSLSLNTFFFAFDHTYEEIVDANEFITGFLLLCGGSKSEKLSVAWELMDSDSDGVLTRSEFFSLIRALLKGVLALQGEAQRAAPHTVEEIIEDTCQEVVGDVFRNAAIQKHGLSFDSFGEYYNGGGYDKISWLELLNLSKWGDVVSEALESSSKVPDENAHTVDQDVLCAFDFSHLPSLALKASAAELYLSAVDASGFNRQSTNDLWKKLDTELADSVKKDRISSHDELIEGIQQLIQHFATNAIESFGAGVTLEYFTIWARFLFRLGLRSYTALKIAMVWLSAGTKSDKLRCCWALFEKHALSRNELQTLFVSLIASLFYFGRMLRIDPDSLVRSGGALVDTICSEIDKEELSFSDFGDWYNSGGYHRAAWLELLDIRKWAQCIRPIEENSIVAEQDVNGEVPFNLNLNISLAGKQVRETFIVDPQRMQQISNFLASTKLASMDMDQLRSLVSLKLPNRQHDVNSFSSILEVREDDVFGPDFLRLLHEFITNICDHSMDADLALCALSPVCRGSKSEKLSYIFSEIGGENGVSREQLERVLLCCFSGVSCLCLFLEQQRPDEKRKRALWKKVRLGVDYAMRSVKEYIPSGNIHYDDFGMWYNNEGTTVAPWLEYLDPKKWLFSSDGVAQGGLDRADEEVAISFGQNSMLRIDSATAEKVQSLVHSTPLKNQSSMELHRLLRSMEAEDDTIPADAVNELINARLSSTASLKKFVTRVFFALDDESENSGVDAIEFSVALSLLCSGSKSDKLRSAFTAFGTGEDKSISDAELWRLLVSAMVGIGCAASMVYEEPSEIPETSIIVPRERSVSLSRHVSDAMMELAILISSECNGQQSEHVTWEEFAKWYNYGGGEKASWLELLDVSKWSPAYWTEGNGDYVEGDATGKSVFEFNLVTGSREQNVVRFNSEDCSAHKRFLKVSDLFKVSVNTLGEAAMSVGNITSKREYNALLRMLIPGTAIGEKEKIFLSYHFNRIYQQLCGVFKNPGSLHSLCALCVLCRGSKSEKLQFCWNQASDGRLETIDSDGLLSILGGFLGAVTSFSEELFSRSDGCAMLLDHCTFVVQVLASKFPRGVSFEDFGAWYNDSGHQLIPWLEFIDARKWPDSPSSDMDTGYRQAGDSSDLSFSENDGNDVDSDHNTSGNLEVPVFVFDVQADDVLHTIQFNKGDSMTARSLHTTLNTNILNDTNRLEEILTSCAKPWRHSSTENNVLDSQRVQDTLLKRLVRKEASSKVTGSCSDILSSLVSLCSALCKVHTPDLPSESVLAEEVACSLIILSDSKKSQKLMSAFTEFGVLSNSKAFADSHRLSEAELGRFFASLFLAILSLSGEYRNAENLPALAELSLSVGRNIAREIGRCTSSNLKEVRVSYGQMVEWYNNEGFSSIPWLELIDLRKWEVTEDESM